MKSQLMKLVTCAFLFASAIFCQNVPLPNGVETHDGFFLRLVPGFGYSNVSETVPDDMLSEQNKGKDILTFSGGFTVANAIQIGGAVSENIIIYGESGGAVMMNPSVKVYEEEVENPGDVLVYLGGIGPGITYYFMPSNIYLSATILASIAMVNIEGDETQNSNIGFGFNFMVGKEWWAGEQWGLGISLYFRYGSQTDQDIEDITISGYSFGALFSATFN
ncbi:MAG: hypothetical protein IH618_12430 [Ignavibacteriaceae bacterium]|nr:hypothetical protein [Ignavibacteriaceae bacterium]